VMLPAAKPRAASRVRHDVAPERGPVLAVGGERA
jgi:hypothetical protein